MTADDIALPLPATIFLSVPRVRHVAQEFMEVVLVHDDRVREADPSGLFSFVHIGDLHLTNVRGSATAISRVRQRTLRSDLTTMLDEIRAIRIGKPSFVYLPGDIADNGRSGEYGFLRRQLRRNRSTTRLPPVYLIPGDHDRQWGRMNAFSDFRSHIRSMRNIKPRVAKLERYPDGHPSQTVPTAQFYYHRITSGVRCIFLDVVSAGYGRKYFGLDFRLGSKQMDWLFRQVAKAQALGQPCAVFMHCYPDDLADRDERAALAGLFYNAGVRLVEMGHTHYNELAPDGRTLYATARSVGQNEDGPVGFAVGAIDATSPNDLVTSWRFKQSQRGWPFVLITSPADRRLATAPLRLIGSTHVAVRALVMSDKPLGQLRCECSVDGGAWVSMQPQFGGVFQTVVPWRDGSKHIVVRVTDLSTAIPYVTDMDLSTAIPYVTDMDTIEPAPIDFMPAPMPSKPGSDKQALESWVVKGVRGDQAGPNRSGYRW